MGAELPSEPMHPASSQQHRRGSTSGINTGKISDPGSLLSLARVHLHHIIESLHRWLLKQCSPENTLNGSSTSITVQRFLEQGVKLLPWAVLEDV